jgi:hypothetical protein
MIYPNPSVNEFTTIEFSLNQSQLIQFKVMGLDGKLIANVLQEKAKAGLNKLYLRTADLPNGVYLLQLQSEHEQVLQAIRFVVAH